MPPPPPPSKSYLLQLSDSDLSSDDDNDKDRQTCRRPPPHNTFQSLAQDSNAFPHGERIHPGAALRKDTPETLATTVDDDEEDIDDDDEAIQEPPSQELLLDPLLATPTTRKTKRNRKKKRNKKRKTQQQAQQQQAVATDAVAAAVAVTAKPHQQPQRRIQFGNVTVRSFERELGTSVVPLDGGWPLGLGAEIVATETTLAPSSAANVVTVDAYEAAKQERLLRRWNQHHQGVETHAKETSVQKDTKEDNNNDKDNVPPPPPPQPPVELETRQWDYKHRTKNPLFGLVTEKQRMALLLGEKDLDELLAEKYAKEQQQATAKSGSASPGGKHGKKNNNNNSPGKKNKKGHNNNNHGNNNNGKSRSNSWNGRTRSGSGNYHNNPNNQERYNEQFTEYDVHHIRNELETIRNQRTQEESRGCTCRRLDVYIPPPGAGKKAAHRRMNVQKVKEELRKRHALPTKHQTREELELLLHDLVAQEPCCRDDNHCPCVKNGIECQSDACQCWHASHQSKTTHKKTSSSSSDEITPAVIRGRCGNRFGMSTVDVNHIGQYRAPFVTATNMVCQPIVVAGSAEATNVQ